MTSFAADLTQQKELNARATARLAWTLANDSYLCHDPIEDFAARGFKQYLPQTKAAGNPISSFDTGVSIMPLTAAFVGQADRESVIGRLPGVVRMDLAGTARLQVGTITAAVVDENTNKPTSALTFALPSQPQKVVAQLTATSEAMRALGSTQTGLTRVLLSAVGRATDDALVAALQAAGQVVDDATPAALLAEIADARWPTIIASLAALMSWPAGTVRDLEALGVTILPTASAAGMMIAVDGGGLLIADDGLELTTARHASIGDDDENWNLWQRNAIQVRCERWLRFGVRAGAAAYASTGSPAL